MAGQFLVSIRKFGPVQKLPPFRLFFDHSIIFNANFYHFPALEGKCLVRAKTVRDVELHAWILVTFETPKRRSNQFSLSSLYYHKWGAASLNVK